MFIRELFESITLDTTVDALITDTLRSSSDMFKQFHNIAITMAEKADDDFNPDRLSFICASRGMVWFHEYYFNNIQKELFDLIKFLPNKTQGIREFLQIPQEDFKDFNFIITTLAKSFIHTGKIAKIPKLLHAGEKILAMHAGFKITINKLIDNLDSKPVASAPRAPSITGSQNAQVEAIINQVLQSLPKSVAGDLRNAISKSPNKLAALQQELNKRNIKFP